MRKNSYFNDIDKSKEEYNIQTEKDEQFINNNRKYSEEGYEEEIKDNPYNESESSREDDLPVKQGLFKEPQSIIKGISLAFVFFSVIIYSLLYMLTPEKSANLIFVGNFDSSIFNDTFCSKLNIKNNFYKLDEVKFRENLIIMNISLFCLSENTNTNNYLKIYLTMEGKGKIINKVYMENETISKDIYIGNNKENIDIIYNDYKINDFPFWLCLYNKENFDMRNITSDYLMNFHF